MTRRLTGTAWRLAAALPFGVGLAIAFATGDGGRTLVLAACGLLALSVAGWWAVGRSRGVPLAPLGALPFVVATAIAVVGVTLSGDGPGIGGLAWWVSLPAALATAGLARALGHDGPVLTGLLAAIAGLLTGSLVLAFGWLPLAIVEDVLRGPADAGTARALAASATGFTVYAWAVEGAAWSTTGGVLRVSDRLRRAARARTTPSGGAGPPAPPAPPG